MDEVAEILARISRRSTSSRRRARAAAYPEPGALARVGDQAADGFARLHRRVQRLAAELPQTIRQLVFTVKRYYRPEWGENWREHFTVDRINGFLGHELKYDNQKLVGNYLRVGFDPQGSWRIYKLRPDFHPAEKVQVEDDITASVVVPRHSLKDFDSKYPNRSVKLVENCEAFLFQRPDDAIHRGFDAQAEADIATPGTFLSNFEPLTVPQAKSMVDHVVEFDQYTEPMKLLLRDFATDPKVAYAVSSAHARLVDGRPSKNPRYLQKRPDLVDPQGRYLAEVCARLDRGIPADQPVRFPVNAVLAGAAAIPRIQDRPAAAGRLQPDSLSGTAGAVHGFHLQPDRQVSVHHGIRERGRADQRPVQFGFAGGGSEQRAGGGHTDGVRRLHHGGRVCGSAYRVDHDISMLAPEVWCRMRVPERDPRFLIENGFLEKMADFEWQGRTVLASRLGYRITALFAERFLGRIFETPDTVFPEEMLRPEKQDMDAFAAGVDAIVAAQKRVAENYFYDGSVQAACPPLQALLHIMAHGEWEGKGVAIRGCARCSRGNRCWRAIGTRNVCAPNRSATWRCGAGTSRRWRPLSPGQDRDSSTCAAGLPKARAQMARVSSVAYLAELVGTIGADPFTDD
jgi:hypothetical protein